MAKRKREIFARLNGTRSKVLAFLSLKSIVSCLYVDHAGIVTVLPNKKELIGGIISDVLPEIEHWLEDQLWTLKERDLKKGIDDAEKFEQELQRVFYKPEQAPISPDEQKMDDTIRNLQAIQACAQQELEYDEKLLIGQTTTGR